MMGRQERPLNPSEGTLEAFASGLRSLRRAAGSPSYRALARRAGYSASSLAAAASGRTVPSLAVTLAYVGACRGDLAEWEVLWEGLQVKLAAEGKATAPVTPTASAAPEPAATPRELPLDVYGFTGRDTELAALDALLEAGGHDSDLMIAAVSGTGGVGKTALVVHWAHRVTDRLPDDTDERIALYRSLLAGRRVLVVLDNAHSTAQVRSLLPGTSSCLAVVTSRDSLEDLVAGEGARRVDLDLLPRAEAVALLRTLIGERVVAEREAAATLAERCARLPLALRIAAERAVDRATVRLTDLVAELAGHRGLELFEAGADERTAVRAVFSWSYRYLPPDAARAFRLLGLHPGQDIDRYAVAALVGGAVDQTWQTVEVLERAHLVAPTHTGRVGMHDLLRHYAAEHATNDDNDADRHAALTRLLDHYLMAASAAMDTLFPHERHRRPDPPVRGDLSIPDLSEPAAARAWLDTERSNLVAATAFAAQHGWPAHAGKLAAVVWRYLYAGAHHVDALTIHTHALQAARQETNRSGEAAAIHNIGRVYWRWGRHDEAQEHFERALAIYREVGGPSEVGAVLNNLGNLLDLLGRFDEAIDRYKEALAILGNSGDLAGEAATLGNLGIIYEIISRQDEAIENHQQALTIFRQVGDHGGVGRTLDNLGSVFFRQGRYHEALHYYEQALALADRIDNRVRQTSALVGLGDTLRLTGHPGRALARYQTALDLAGQTGDRYERAHALEGIGHVLCDSGHTEPARRHWTEALEIYTDLDIAEADLVRDLIRGAAQGSRS